MKQRFFASIALLAALSALHAEVPENYYAILEGRCGAALKTAAKVAGNTGREPVSYGDGTWRAFKETDTRVVNGQLCWWDMYYPGAVSVESGHPGMNIEHSVPNSWWGGIVNDAYKDLFNLNPSDEIPNGWKRNYPLGVVEEIKVTGSGEIYDNAYTMVGRPASGASGGATWVFEPCDEFKGDFARTYFYMFTVYDDIEWLTDRSDRNYMFDGSNYPTLKPWAYRMLLEWARMDPVSEKETERNEAIFRIQKNRNPFIDNPDLAEHIWGDAKSTPFVLPGVETVVRTFEAEEGEGPLFDLTGREVRCPQPQPGIYVKGGRKILVR